MSLPEPDHDDTRLITLAAGARARVAATTGAAVRDTTGRSYVGADVVLPSLRLDALELALAPAIAAGASGLEAAAVVAVEPQMRHRDRELLKQAGGGDAPVWLADTSGNVLAQERA